MSGCCGGGGDSREIGTGQPRNVGKSPFTGVCEGDLRRGGVIKVAVRDESRLCFLSRALVHTSPSRCLLVSNRSVVLWGDVLISHL